MAQKVVTGIVDRLLYNLLAIRYISSRLGVLGSWVWWECKLLTSSPESKAAPATSSFFTIPELPLNAASLRGVDPL